MNLRDLGLRIRRQREKRGLKQQDIANALNVSPQAVSKWERAENAPDIAIIVPLAKLLGVTVEWLLTAGNEQRDTFPATVFASTVAGAYEKSVGMAPRDFAVWANGLFYQLTELTLRENGVPVKYMGDRYLAFFAGPGHAARAVRTAFQARQLVTDKLRIGLSSGEIYLGTVGHPDYARPDIMGEVVNIAFLTMEWTEKNCRSGIGATAATAEASGAVVGKRAQVNFLGIEHPVAVCALKSEAPALASGSAPVSRIYEEKEQEIV